MAAPAEAPPGYVAISDDEASRAILVGGIPVLDQEITEQSLVQLFSPFGELNKLLLQNDESGTQRAVIVYGTTVAAKAAVQLSGQPFFDAPLSVMLVSDIPQPRRIPPVSATGSAGEAAPQYSSAQRVGGILASGFNFGRQGFAHVREFDQRLGVSQRAGAFAVQMKSGWASVDERHGISQRVTGLLRHASEKIQEVDSRYDISGKAKGAAQGVARAAEGTKDKAMQNQTVADVATKSGNFLQGVVQNATAWTTQAVSEAQARAGRSTPPPVSPGAGGASASGGGAAAGGADDDAGVVPLEELEYNGGGGGSAGGVSGKTI